MDRLTPKILAAAQRLADLIRPLGELRESGWEKGSGLCYGRTYPGPETIPGFAEIVAPFRGENRKAVVRAALRILHGIRLEASEETKTGGGGPAKPAEPKNLLPNHDRGRRVIRKGEFGGQHI